MLNSGDILHGYRIDARIGRGGMGVVYEATQLSLNRTVALKVLTAELSRDDSFRERFRREGVLQAALEHPHIVTVYEAGESEYGLFLAMRLIRGPNLKDLIIARQLDLGRTLRIVSQAGDALDTAHEARLIHRDIKPHNILIAAGRDHAYLADFGVTKGPGDFSLTGTGLLMGTLDYISPEQIRGHRATSASDIYAFACVLYECLTGVVPFPKDSDAAVLFAHVSDPPPLVSEHRPELPRGLDEVLQRAMAKEPGERHLSARYLIDDVEQALGDRLKTTIAAPAPIEFAEQAGIRRPSEMTDTPAMRAAPATRLAAPSEYGARPVGRSTPPPLVVEALTPLPRPFPEARVERGWAGPARLAALGVCIAAIVAGFLVGNVRANGQSTSPGSREVSSGKLTVFPPVLWQRLRTVPGVLRSPLGNALALAHRGRFGSGGLVGGTVAANAPTFMPGSLRAALPAGALDDRQRVRLGSLEAFRYANLVPAGFDGTVTVYAVPQPRNVILLGCFLHTGAPRSIVRSCEGIIATVRIDGARTISLAPSNRYADTLNAVIRKLRSQRAAGLKQLRSSKLPTDQAAASESVARAYGTAAARLRREPTTILTRGSNAAIVVALGRTQAAYVRLAGGARRRDRTQYDSARQVIAHRQAGLQNALEGLRPLGFVFE